MKKEYYEAYEDRYKDAYDNNMLWEIKDFSKDVVKVIEDYNITKNNSILEVGLEIQFIYLIWVIIIY